MSSYYQQVETSHTTVQVGGVSTAVLAANSARRLLILQNVSSTATFWVNVSSGTAAADVGLMLGAGGGFTFDVAVPTGAVTAICATSTAQKIIATQGV